MAPTPTERAAIYLRPWLLSGMARFITSMRRMPSVCCAAALVLVALSTSVGCSDDERKTGGGSEGKACQSQEDCPLFSCTCRDGVKVSMPSCALTRCEAGSTACDKACSTRGGLESFREQPTVKDSAECEAFCAKGASLACGAASNCDRLFYCALDDGECADAKRAHLKCVAEQGQWACSGSGGWTVTSGCPSARCAADAGAR